MFDNFITYRLCATVLFYKTLLLVKKGFGIDMREDKTEFTFVFYQCFLLKHEKRDFTASRSLQVMMMLLEKL